MCVCVCVREGVNVCLCFGIIERVCVCVRVLLSFVYSVFILDVILVSFSVTS